jgi:hypothetical protein
MVKTGSVKFMVTLMLILVVQSVFCQSSQIRGQLKYDTSAYYGELILNLKQGDSTVRRTVPDKSGFFDMEGIPAGTYHIVITCIGYRPDEADTIQILSDTSIDLVLSYPPPCRFVYKKGHKPSCVGGHTDHIIPISYGLPTGETMNKAKKGLVHLGGCMVSDCDPKYYCTIHKREL